MQRIDENARNGGGYRRGCYGQHGYLPGQAGIGALVDGPGSCGVETAGDVLRRCCQPDRIGVGCIDGVEGDGEDRPRDLEDYGPGDAAVAAAVEGVVGACQDRAAEGGSGHGVHLHDRESGRREGAAMGGDTHGRFGRLGVERVPGREAGRVAGPGQVHVPLRIGGDGGGDIVSAAGEGLGIEKSLCQERATILPTRRRATQSGAVSDGRRLAVRGNPLTCKYKCRIASDRRAHFVPAPGAGPAARQRLSTLRADLGAR